MPFSLTQLTQPSREVLTLDEVKEFLRIDSTDQDGVLTALIYAARCDAEHFTNRALLPQQWRLTLDRFPGSWPYTYGYGMVQSPQREIRMPIGPLISIDKIVYPDPSTTDPVELTDYQVVIGEEGRIQPAYGTAWPIAAWTIGGINIDFTVGHMDEESSPVIGNDKLPGEFSVAMKWTIGHWYENREGQEIPPGPQNLLRPHRIWSPAPVVTNWGRLPR